MNRSINLPRMLVDAAVLGALLALLGFLGVAPAALGWTAAAGAAFIAFEGVSLYNRCWPQPHDQPAHYELHTVQLDDFGSFWKPQEADHVLRHVEAAAQAGNTFVYVFIHGWNHNAAPGDSNLRDFNHKTLAKLCKDLSTPSRRALREKLSGSADFRLIGIYVGWRGRSLPGLLNFGTMWWRKAAAERVGEGDVSEFIERLQRMYLRANSIRREPHETAVKPMMGLVTIGHSFGGQVLLKSVARSLEYALTERASTLADVTRPAANAPATDVRIPVDSLGDLNILLNPATEAYQFGRIDDLYRQLRFPDRQTPQLVVFSAVNDVPRKCFFPIARVLTLPFRPSFRDAYQGRLYGRALGVLAEQQTHAMTRAPGAADSLVDADYATDDARKVRLFDFSGLACFGGVRMQRLPETGSLRPAIANSPVGVVQVRDKVIDGHNGIFGEDFQHFLASYVAFVEGKRLLIRHEDFVKAMHTP